MIADQITAAHRFGVMTLLREAGSSAAATISTLRSLASHASLAPHRAALLNLAAQAENTRAAAKADALLKLLTAQRASSREDKVIIFTQFRATQEILAERLRSADLPCVVYHGGLSAAQKDAAIREFHESQPILLSTEAAGEGRNL